MDRETRNLEYKEEIAKSFLKTVSAYANYGTGKIIFGITDDKNVVGLKDLEEKCLDIENTINRNISPIPDYRITINDDNTIELTVNEGMYKPYLYRNKAYKRNDSSSVEVDRVEFNRLVLEGMNQTFEEQISSKQDLTFDVLEKTLIKELKIEKLTVDILKTLDLVNFKGQYNNAAALLADTNQFSGIDIVKFGKTISEIRDRRTIEKTSILTQFSEAINMYRQYYQYEKIDGTLREKVELIPEKAFREALANSIVHRLWDIEANIKISMYDDHIEISSPGTLLPSISIDEYLNGQVSIFRNPIIGNLFFRLNYIEKFGTGIRRINEAYANDIVKPKFQVYENSISVILPVFNLHSNISEEELKVIECLSRSSSFSRSQIDDILGFTKDKTVRILNSLVERKIIDKVGKGRETRYRLHNE